MFGIVGDAVEREHLVQDLKVRMILKCFKNGRKASVARM